MNLYIRIEGDTIIEHPIFEDNLVTAFPGIDLENLPPGIVRFIRIPEPETGVYEINEGVRYELANDIAKDVWTVRPMTAQEKLDQQIATKNYWAEHGFPSWIFNEDTCSFEPPTLMPTDGGVYRWTEDTKSWELMNE